MRYWGNEQVLKERLIITVMISAKMGRILQKSLAGIGSHDLIADPFIILSTSFTETSSKQDSFVISGHLIQDMVIGIWCDIAANIIVDFGNFVVEKFGKVTG